MDMKKMRNMIMTMIFTTLPPPPQSCPSVTLKRRGRPLIRILRRGRASKSFQIHLVVSFQQENSLSHLDIKFLSSLKIETLYYGKVKRLK